MQCRWPLEPEAQSVDLTGQVSVQDPMNTRSFVHIPLIVQIVNWVAASQELMSLKPSPEVAPVLAPLTGTGSQKRQSDP